MVMSRGEIKGYTDEACKQSFAKCVEAMCHVRHMDQLGNPIGKLENTPNNEPNFALFAQRAAEELALIIGSAKGNVSVKFLMSASKVAVADYAKDLAREQWVAAKIADATAVTNKTWAMMYIANHPDVCPKPPALLRAPNLSVVRTPVVQTDDKEFVSLPLEGGGRSVVGDVQVRPIGFTKSQSGTSGWVLVGLGALVLITLADLAPGDEVPAIAAFAAAL